MRYLFLLYGDTDGEGRSLPTSGAGSSTSIWPSVASWPQAGALQLAEALAPADRGFVLRRERSGRAVTTDGPFVEAKEQLGSVYVVECPDRAAAEALAARLPQSPGLVVEVRPVAD